MVSGLTDEPVQVDSREDLADFLASLAADFAHNRQEWENVTIDAFLDAWSAWLRSCDQLYRNRDTTAPASPTWQFIADMLLAARVYE